MKRNKKSKNDEIKYADKYLYGDNYSDRFDYLRKKDKEKYEIDHTFVKTFFKYGSIVLSCLILFTVGYFSMNLIMNSNQMPKVDDSAVTDKQPNDANKKPSDMPTINDTQVNYQAMYIPSTALDGGSMINSVIDVAIEKGYNAVVFDLKRSDGTLAYDSKLTNAITYSAVSSPANNVKKSIKLLYDNNITPIARIFTFQDNNTASQDALMAIKVADQSSIWLDNDGKGWLNPYSNEANNYLYSIMKEVAGLGINTIILDSVKYPKGDINNAYFADGVIGTPRDDVLSAFVDGAKEAVGDNTKILISANVNVESKDTLLDDLIDFYTNIGNNEDFIPMFTSKVEISALLEELAKADVKNYVIISYEGEE